MDQTELKSRLKVAIKAAGLDYGWLADMLGVTKCTVNNYMAKKTIPALQVPNMENILARLESGSYDEVADNVPTKKKRHRRTNEQIRKDTEESMRIGQQRLAEEGFVDQEAEDAKWKEFGQQCLDNYRKEVEESTKDFRTHGILDMSDPVRGQVHVEPDSYVYRIAVPAEIVAIYRKEVKQLNEGLLPKDIKVTISTLLARAITDDARAIINCD